MRLLVVLIAASAISNVKIAFHDMCHTSFFHEEQLRIAVNHATVFFLRL